MNISLKALTCSAACLAISFSSCAERHKKAECNVAIVSDLHFDMPPETDQYRIVKAVNALGKRVDIDAVAMCGDIFDKSHPQIMALYRQRWEKGNGDRQIHYNVFPAFGNHDVSPESGRPAENTRGFEYNMHYLDSLLKERMRRGEILNLDPSSRSYSYDIGGVHFIQGQLSAGETSYCNDNMQWLAADLKRYCDDGRPVVYLQHYGFDEDALGWWSEERRKELFMLLDNYNLAAFFVGHTHQASVQYYNGIPVFQVNNAWDDGDGKASFVLLRIKGNKVRIENHAVADDNGNTMMLQPVINMRVPVNKPQHK